MVWLGSEPKAAAEPQQQLVERWSTSYKVLLQCSCSLSVSTAVAPTGAPAAAAADVGFGVGHTRETETKGIWVWGQPQPAEGGSKTVRGTLYVCALTCCVWVIHLLLGLHAVSFTCSSYPNTCI
jgi:hypothetical protein